MATQDKNKWRIQDIQNYINQNNIPEEIVGKKSKEYEKLAANATSEAERTNALQKAENYRNQQNSMSQWLGTINTSLATPVEQQRILNAKLSNLDDLLGGELSRTLGDISKYGYKMIDGTSAFEGPAIRFQILRKDGGKLKRFS